MTRIQIMQQIDLCFLLSIMQVSYSMPRLKNKNRVFEILYFLVNNALHSLYLVK